MDNSKHNLLLKAGHNEVFSMKLDVTKNLAVFTISYSHMC